MTHFMRSLLGCVDRKRLEDFLHGYVPRLIARAADRWDDKSRLRRLITHFGVDDAQEFAKLAITEALDDFLGPAP